MKKLLITLALFVFLLLGSEVKSQLPDGSYGKNFTMQDYLGTSYSLYDYLDAGKPVILDVSATWCSPCWSYHTGGALEAYYNSYGPTGDNTSMVFWIEGDQSSLACLQGTGSSCGVSSHATQGNWTSGTTFPMFLTVSPNSAQVVTDYNIGYFPTVYLICPNRSVTEVGTLNSTGLHAAVLGCPSPGVNALDAAVWSTNVPSKLCETSVTPTFSLQNYGNTALTSCNVVVKLDGSVVSTTPWTGSLAKYEIIQVVVPAVTGITDGTHILTFEITSPNGGADENTANNSKAVTFAASLPLTATPVIEGFVNSAFPPANWLISNPDNGDTWARSATAGGFGNTTNSTFLDFYNIESGNTDDLIMPPVDLSGTTVASLTFNLAHKRYSTTYSDKLQVDVSKNCGTTWTTVWTKSGATLATVTGVTTTEYVPASTDWRAENVNLSAYAGQSKVFIRFRGTSNYGNDVYVDDINLSLTASVDEQANSVNNLTVFPNPTSGKTSIDFELAKPEPISLSICNPLGQNIILFENKPYPAGAFTEYFSTESMNPGVYYLILKAGEQKYTQKIIIVK
jgi:hypothetical protein